ncbi:hypothetical protein JCM8097_002786, partial [Rhodosporidiobolus ruineniae]
SMGHSEIPSSLLSRILKRQPVPLFYFCPSVLLKLKLETNSELAKKVNAVSNLLPLDDDYQIAGNLAEHVVALQKYISVLKGLARGGSQAYPADAVNMIIGHLSVVMDKFTESETDQDKMDLLMYDIERRRVLFKPEASNLSVNIASFDPFIWQVAVSKRQDFRLNLAIK